MLIVFYFAPRVELEVSIRQSLDSIIIALSRLWVKEAIYSFPQARSQAAVMKHLRSVMLFLSPILDDFDWLAKQQ